MPSNLGTMILKCFEKDDVENPLSQNHSELSLRKDFNWTSEAVLASLDRIASLDKIEYYKLLPNVLRS